MKWNVNKKIISSIVKYYRCISAVTTAFFTHVGDHGSKKNFLYYVVIDMIFQNKLHTCIHI